VAKLRVRILSLPGSPRGLPWATSPIAAFASLAAAACSLLVANDDSQCHVTADCLARGPDFAATYCDSGACVASCTTNQQCTGASVSDPWICRADHSCARLLSGDCTTVLADPADLTDPSVLWLGMLLPLDPATQILSLAKEDAADLARQDFNLASGGLPPAVSGGSPRRFAFVVCDDTVDPDRAAAHLTDDVRVPGIIGPVYSDTLIQVATDVTIPRGVLLMTPTATSTYITDLPGKNDLVWRTCPSDAVQALAMALVVQATIEPAVRASVLGAAAPLKLENVHKGDAYGLGLGNAFEQDVIFNGVSAAVNEANGDYLAFDYGDPSSPSDTDPDAEYRAAVAGVLGFAPHVVAVAGTQEAITNILAPVEAGWPASLPYRPRYLLGDGAYPRPELLQLVGTDAVLRARVLGTAPGTTSMLYTHFLARYASIFHDGTQAVLSTSATYDAAYLLAYAAAAAGSNPMTGADLVGGLKRVVVPGAAPFDVGTDSINQALDVLASGSNVKLTGTSGPLDYDVSTGETDGDIQVWCLSIDASGSASGFQNSGLFYSATTRSLQGQIDCP
jgi:ABC-type branched-subunit amino acid transport system substrate-binding protein